MIRTTVLAALAGAALLTAGAANLDTAAPAAAATAATSANSIVVSVRDVTPSTPSATTRKKPLTVELRLTNATAQAFGKLTVKGARGNPISTQQGLDAAIAHPLPPDPTEAGTFAATRPATTALAAHASTTLDYTSSSDTILDDAGLCICQNRIYPLYFAVHVTTAAGDTVVGSTQTFVPAFGISRPRPVQVSWVWPLLERPHRLTSDTVFTDDDLAASASTGGRLDRMLSVVEMVGQSVPMTLVVDPDLIDELEVMSAGSYRVSVAGHGTVAGTGAAAAGAWLARLRAVLDYPGTDIALTAFADPDVESLAGHGLAWANHLAPAAQARVAAALGGRTPQQDIAWPQDETLSQATLTDLVRKGTGIVLVDDKTLRGGTDVPPPRDALAPLATDAGPAVAAVTSSTLERYVAQVLTPDATGLASLPLLVSELAVRAVEDGSRSHYVVLTAPRGLNPDPATAARAIVETARTPWSTSISLRRAVGGAVAKVAQGRLVLQQRSGLPDRTIDVAHEVAAAVPALTSMITRPVDAQTLLGTLPAAAQRTASADWGSATAVRAAYATRLSRQVHALQDAVHLAVPTTGTYTLGSTDSPLPVTIANTLPVGVSVRIRIQTVGGLPGFSADDIGVKTIVPDHTTQLRVPVHVDRAGRIRVQVVLLTPKDTPVGSPLELSVHSTALGEIGKLITIAAAVVLALALLVRVARRWHRRPPPPPAVPPLVAQGAGSAGGKRA
ncbi:MAG: DUF6049 family protein [Jatrophihabitantaceae bacterium]